MIPLLIAGIIILIIFALVLYAFNDLDNRLYANIFALIIAIILCFVISMWSFQGAIGDITPVIQTQSTATVENVTNTSYIYENQVSNVLKDAAMGWIFMFLGFCLSAVTVYLGFEAWIEYQQDKETARYE